MATVWLASRANTEDAWVRHTLAVRNQIADVLTFVQRAETSQRGFLLTNRVSYLAPYSGAKAALPGMLDEMNKLVSDNPQQVDAVNKLRKLITDKLNEMDSTLVEQKAGRPDAAVAIVKTDVGIQMMNDIRTTLLGMDAEENRLLTIRQTSSAKFSTFLQIGAGAAFLLICAMGVMTG